MVLLLAACEAPGGEETEPGKGTACPRQSSTGYVKTVDDNETETFWHASAVRDCLLVYTQPIGGTTPNATEKHDAVQRSLEIWNDAAVDCDV